MKTLTRRLLLGSVSAVALSWPAESSIIKIGAGEGGGDTPQLTTMTLVNTSRSTQSPGFITPIFGMTFKKGDIPRGTAPIFTIGSTPQPFSWGLQSYYSDGSLRHASFMFRCSSSIAGNGTLTININSGGTTPAASSRTLMEVYAQLIQVGGAGVGAFGGLTGTWNAYLRNDANNVEQYVYMDGQAGTCWRIKTHFAQSAGGTAHGQLECYHYVTALQDGSGNLGGFRHIARINQPYYNNDTPTKALRAFSSISWQHGSGPTVIPLTWPFNNINFTGSNGSSVFTVASSGTHNLYNGGQPGEGADYRNCVPGYLISTTDAALSTSQIYFAYTYRAATNNTNFLLSKNTTGTNSGLVVSSGGNSTFVPIPVCLHAESIYTADNQGRANFFQGTGSMSADGTVRTQFNQTYLHSTGAIPPWNLSLSGTAFGGAIKDIPAIVGASSSAYWTGSPTWNPVTAGPLTAWRGGAGSVPDLGPLTTWHCAHFYNQTAVGDMVVRSIAFASDFDGIGVRDVTTGNYVNVLKSSYTGMPAPSSNQQSTFAIIANQCYGFTAPSTPPLGNTSFLWGGDQNTAHKPSMAYYAFLVFGEPHFYDLMIEAATGGVAEVYGAAARVPTGGPTGGYGIIMTKSGESLRGSAWGLRDITLAANFAANYAPDGSAIRTYLSDIVTNNLTYANALFSATYLGSTLNSENSWRTLSYDGTTIDYADGGFHMGYFECVTAWVSCLQGVGSASALTWMNSYSTWLNYVVSTYGAYHLYCEYDGAVIYDNKGDITGPITSFSQYGITSGVYDNITWTNSGPRSFTITNPKYGYVVTAGDKWVFMGDQGAPGGFSIATAYYTRDVSGNTCNFAAAPGGTAITPSNTGTIYPAAGSIFLDASSPFLILAAPPPASSGLIPTSSIGGPNSYLLYRKMAWDWATIAGATGYSTPLKDANARLKANFPDFTRNANWYGQNGL